MEIEKYLTEKKMEEFDKNIKKYKYTPLHKRNPFSEGDNLDIRKWKEIGLWDLMKEISMEYVDDYPNTLKVMDIYEDRGVDYMLKKKYEYEETIDGFEKFFSKGEITSMMVYLYGDKIIELKYGQE